MKKYIVMAYIGMGLIGGAFAYEADTISPVAITLGFCLTLHGLLAAIDKDYR